MLDETFSPEIRRHGLTIIRGNCPHDALLTRYPWGYKLSIHSDLDRSEARTAAALLIGRVDLQHDLFRSGWLDLSKCSREHRDALLWAARRLIPDTLMRRAQRLGWEIWELAEAADVTPHLALTRFEDWHRTLGKVALFRSRAAALSVMTFR